MKRRIRACLTLLLCLTLTACGGGLTGGGQASYLAQAARVEDGETLLTVDGREVPAWRYLYWLSRSCGVLGEQLPEGASPDWDASVEEGVTLAEYVKRQALTDTALYATVENWAGVYDCVPTESVMPGGVLLAEAAVCGLDADCAETLSAVGEMYAALYRLFCTEGGALSPAAGELESFAREAGYRRVHRILYAAGTDAQAAAARAAEAFAQLNAAAEPETVFQALAEAGDDLAGPRLYCPGDGTFDPALEAAAAALEEGQYSGILETAEGCSLLLRLPVDPAALREVYFDYLLETAAAQAEITQTKTYEQLDVPAFYQRLAKLREEK